MFFFFFKKSPISSLLPIQLYVSASPEKYVEETISRRTAAAKAWCRALVEVVVVISDAGSASGIKSFCGIHLIQRVGVHLMTIDHTAQPLRSCPVLSCPQDDRVRRNVADLSEIGEQGWAACIGVGIGSRTKNIGSLAKVTMSWIAWLSCSFAGGGPFGGGKKVCGFPGCAIRRPPSLYLSVIGGSACEGHVN